jgi:hypothetical protein
MTRAARQETASAILARLAEENRRNEGIAGGRRNARGIHEGPATMEVDAVMKGVTVGWLAQAFGMNFMTVKNKLRDCPPLRKYKNGFLYDIRVACSFLIKPRFDIENFIKNANVSDLPPKLTREYWGAKTARLQYEEEAGHLWRDEAVLTLYGDLFATVKSEHQQWAATLEKTVGLTDKQHILLQEMVDQLEDKIHKQVLTVLGRKKHRSVLQEDIDRENAERQAQVKSLEEDEEDMEALVASLV